jgi:hypothetical protein
MWVELAYMPNHLAISFHVIPPAKPDPALSIRVDITVVLDAMRVAASAWQLYEASKAMCRTCQKRRLRIDRYFVRRDTPPAMLRKKWVSQNQRKDMERCGVV